MKQWPTYLMLVGCYGGIAALTELNSVLPYWITIPLLSIAFALHSSLQHELLHGNPFKRQAINDAIGFPAVGLFVPYERFKTTHLDHHRDECLTDPHDDPESNYLDPVLWAQTPAWLQRLYRWNNTLSGRMLIGPIIGMSNFYKNDIAAIGDGDAEVRRAYLLHAGGVALAAFWILGIANYSFIPWLIASYGALSILRIRTFLEHQADDCVECRTAIVNDHGPLAYVFLYNNLHTVHHAHPRMPWYELPKYYQKNQAFFDERNNHYHYKNYWQVIKTYWTHTKDAVPHPLMSTTDTDRTERS